MKQNIQKISIIALITAIGGLLIYTLVYFIQHNTDQEYSYEVEVETPQTAVNQLDIVTQPTATWKVSDSELPKTTGTLTELNLKNVKKLFASSKKSLLILEKDGCSHCEALEPEYIKILEANELTSYKINISNYSTSDLKTLTTYLDFQGTPTIYVIENGQVSHTFTGEASKELIMAFIDIYYVR